MSAPVLRRGDRGEWVEYLQRQLESLGYELGAPDGQFGPKTQSAVKAFQSSAGLDADGIVGPHTWGALGITAAGNVVGDVVESVADMFGGLTPDERSDAAASGSGSTPRPRSPNDAGMSKAFVVDAEAVGLEPQADLPESTFRFFDENSGSERELLPNEFESYYVDNNIERLSLMAPSVYDDIETQTMAIGYTTGAHYEVVLGDIGLHFGNRPDYYSRRGDLIFPCDHSGNPLFDALNTHNLAEIKLGALNSWARLQELRLEIGEVTVVMAALNASQFDFVKALGWAE